MDELNVKLGADARKLSSDLNTAKGKIKGFTEQSGQMMNGFGSIIAGAFSVTAALEFTKQVFRATAEFQKFGAVLGNTLGSAALANIQLKQIAEFAAKTPFGINELTGAFVKLANAGFKPTADQMTRLGDLASSTGKSFDQLAEAILDAQSGEFERLKEFGIRAKDAGDSVIFTYKGVQTQTEKTSSAIRDYITALGATEGVSGSMAVISETLTGKISNLGDAWDMMLVSVGGNTEGVFSGVISTLNQAITKITEYNRIASTAGKYGIKASIGDRLQGLITSDKAIPVLKSEFILDAEANVSKQVTAFIQGAKSVKAFETAIKSLYEQGKRETKGILDANFASGIADQYAQGIKALQDARRNFSKSEAKGKPNANFGRPKKAPKVPEEPKVATQDWLDLMFAKTRDESMKGLGKSSGLVGDDNASKIMAQQAAENLRKASERNKAMVAESRLTLEQFVTYVSDTLGRTFGDFFANIVTQGTFSFQELGRSILGIFNRILSDAITQRLSNFFQKIIGGLLTVGTGGASGILGGIAKFLIPGFANGVENFSGGLAYVHAGEVLTNLAPGTSVIPANQVNGMGGGGGQVFIANSYLRNDTIVTSYERGNNTRGRII